MNYVLYNPLAQAGNGKNNFEAAKDEFTKALGGEFTTVDLVEYDPDEFFKKIDKKDKILIVGGDGTLNVFANNIKAYGVECEMYYYKGGNGNDFLEDIKESDDQKLVYLNPYLKRLPRITVNGMTRYYINGIGYGIDGMVCEVADKLKAQGKKNINYASLSIKLLLHGYKCPNAIAVVDGAEYRFNKVWLCSAMNGRFYGGGMKIAPGQDRLGESLSLSVIYNAGKLRTLMIFPKIFKGEHVRNQKMSKIITGRKITVTFTHPMALQIDGEVVSNVTTYTVEI